MEATVNPEGNTLKEKMETVVHPSEAKTWQETAGTSAEAWPFQARSAMMDAIEWIQGMKARMEHQDARINALIQASHSKGKKLVDTNDLLNDHKVMIEVLMEAVVSERKARLAMTEDEG